MSSQICEHTSPSERSRRTALPARLARIALNRARKSKLVARDARVSLIGDHLNDIRAAKANGFRSIGVATGLMPFEELKSCGPDIVVRDVTELHIDEVL